MIIYLSGPIAGISPEESSGWRNKATEILTAAGHQVLDPLREWGKPFEQVTPAEIVERDLDDIADSGAVLVGMDWPNVPCIGTAMEILYASIERLMPVIVWGRANRGSHWLKYYTTAFTLSHWFDTLDEALAYLVKKP